MNKITITEPIVLLTVNGDVKDNAKSLPFVDITSYEKYIDKTYIVSKVIRGKFQEGEIITAFSELLSIPEEDIIDLKYSESGIDFITVD